LAWAQQYTIISWMPDDSRNFNVYSSKGMLARGNRAWKRIAYNISHIIFMRLKLTLLSLINKSKNIITVK